jgi:predicted nucleic acid-binding Zn ribbon protein
MTPKLNCESCGSDRFAYPFKVTDDSTIACEDCGATVGTFAELRGRVADQIAQGPAMAASPAVR